MPVPEGREFAESSQQGAQKNLHQHQQPQQQTDQGNLKKKRAFCFRCKCSGHVNEACKADLDCIICNKKNSHLSSKCPILKIPKPSASFFGSGKKELAFVLITEADYKLEAPEPAAPTGLITVTGAQITADIVQSELARITRSDWRGRLYHMARILSWLRS